MRITILKPPGSPNDQDEADEQVGADSARSGAAPPAKSLATIFAAYTLIFSAFSLGAVSLVSLTVFLFHGSFELVELDLDEPTALALDTGLCLLFFLQHSIMIRKPFRRWLARFVRAQYHAALYTIVSATCLLALVVFWQKSVHILADPQGTTRVLMRMIFFMGFFGFRWGMRSLRRFDGFGIGAVLRYLRGKEPAPQSFIVRGPYRWVRHPLYFFALVQAWSCPHLTADRLLFNILWTAYIIVGTLLEERDLIAVLGAEYRDYQRNVPMLIPYNVRPYVGFDRGA